MVKAKEIKNHFKNNDPVIYQVMADMDLVGLSVPKSSGNYFLKICREIIAQQLASKAAHKIIERFYKLFNKKNINPADVLAFSEQELRNVGMSWAKAGYILDLAKKVNDKEVKIDNLHNLDNESVIKELVKVKGIGRWTAEMFLIFTLGREDVYSMGDFGLRKAIKNLYSFKKMPTDKQIIKIISRWTPYKSYGSLALWKSLG